MKAGRASIYEKRDAVWTYQYDPHRFRVC